MGGVKWGSDRMAEGMATGPREETHQRGGEEERPEGDRKGRRIGSMGINEYSIPADRWGTC